MNWSIWMSMKSPRLSVFGALCLMTTGLACGGTPPPPPDSALIADPPPSDGTPGEGLMDLDRGRGFVKQEQWEEAQAHLEKAVEAMPKNGEAHYLLALTQLKQGDAASAEAGFKRAVALDAKLYEAAVQLGSLYAGGEAPRCKEALEVLLPALKSIPDDEEKSFIADTQELVGFCAWDTGDFAASKTHYEASLAAEDRPMVHFAMASMLMEAKKPKDAVPHFEAYAKSVLDQPKKLAEVGPMLARAGAPDRCVALLDKAVELDADAKAPLMLRGQCKLQNADAEGARADFMKVLEMDNRFQPAYFYVGVSWLESKNRPKAAEAFQQVIRIDKTTKVAKAAQKRLEELAKKR